MANLEGKHFSITDPKDVSTVIYRINETEKEFRKDSPKYTVERLDSFSEIRGENTKRTYFIDNPSPEYDQLVILSFAKERVVVNSGILGEDRIKISKQPSFVIITSFSIRIPIHSSSMYIPGSTVITIPG